ncbi:MAG: TetR/AcrR family transcriptional regulator [Afipia sp.]|nr:TetR/AcrR family transcriptional regulator [Afipia sp.]
MARTTGSTGVKTKETIRRAAIKRIYQHGFEAMKLRDLADDVGIQAGSLYNYIKYKEDFLYLLLKEVLLELLEGLAKEVEGPETPLEALEAFIAFHLRWHTARREEVFIGNMELRSLSPSHSAEIVGLRETYEKKLRDILEWGNKDKVWKVRDPKVTTYAIIAMLTGVCTWYKPRGRLSQEQLIEVYRELVLRGIGLLKK